MKYLRLVSFVLQSALWRLGEHDTSELTAACDDGQEQSHKS